MTKQAEFEVYKTVDREYRTSTRASANRWGCTEVAKSHKSVSWSVRIGTRVIDGYSTKKQAIEAAQYMVGHTLLSSAP
jgi:hypothetical protein